MKLITILFLLGLSNSYAKSSSTITCGDRLLPLKAKATRTATIFKIKVYVLSIFGDKKDLSPPTCFEFTYLRDFDDEDVDKAWVFQFKESSEYEYPGLKEDLATLKRFYGGIHGKRTQRLELLEGTTRIYENDVYKGEIKGHDFQRSFLSIWKSPKSPIPELKL